MSEESTKMEPTLRSTQVLKQEEEDIGLTGKEVAEYVREQQTLDREERVAWREAEAEDKKRADELQAEEKKRANEIRLAQIEIEKELKIKELEQDLAATLPPRNKDAKSPKLPSFIDKKDELDSYLLHFEHNAVNASWEKNTWATKLSALLTGRAMDVYTRMSDKKAND